MLASMFMDCLYYQVDLIGDADMAAYRASGTKQESIDIRGSMRQSTLDYFFLALCCPRVHHVKGNSILWLLKQHEDQKPDWNTLLGLDPMVATVLEWGHSSTHEQWANSPGTQAEFKINVSEWLLNSTSANYLLKDRDYDAHTPLLIEVHANQYTGGRL